MKIFKRTPQSEIPLTVHRRVGRGNGERGVEKERGVEEVCVCVCLWGGGEGGEIMNSIWN